MYLFVSDVSAAVETLTLAVLSGPKVTTPVSCLNEICVATKLSIPQYELKGEVALPMVTIFSMEVWVRDMNLRGMLHPS